MYFTHMMIAATRILCPAKFDLESRNSKLKSGKVAFRNVAKIVKCHVINVYAWPLFKSTLLMKIKFIARKYL